MQKRQQLYFISRYNTIFDIKTNFYNECRLLFLRLFKKKIERYSYSFIIDDRRGNNGAHC